MVCLNPWAVSPARVANRLLRALETWSTEDSSAAVWSEATKSDELANRPLQEQAHFQVDPCSQAGWSEATKIKEKAQLLSLRLSFFTFKERHQLHVLFSYTFNSATAAFSIGELLGSIQAGTDFLALANNFAAQQ
jgi:hypothetical protein